MIQTQSYTINNLLLTNEMITSYIHNFWNDVFTPIENQQQELARDGKVAFKNRHLLLLIKVHFDEGSNASDGGYKTLGNLRKVNYRDKDLFIDYIIDRLGYVTESYFSNKITKITFTYVTREGLAPDTEGSFKLECVTPINHSFNNLKLPISMNPSDYGKVIIQNFIQIEGKVFERFIVTNANKTFQIDVSKDGITNKVQLLGNSDISWTDTKIEENSFKREIGKSIIYFTDGQIVLRKKVLNCKPFSKLAQNKDIGPNFVTLDIETVIRDGKHIPYLICAYNGSSEVKVFANTYEEDGVQQIDQVDLFKRFIKELCTLAKGSKFMYVYAHNLGKFDGVLMLRHLLPFGKVEPILHNGKIISIKLILLNGKIIIFKDSLLLLPKDLKSLGKSYNVEVKKGHFPFKLHNINYVGKLPTYDYWSNISKLEFLNLVQEYKNREWNFREEAIKYCIQDCISLHQVLTKFNELVFKEFNVNIHKSLTLPSLAMRIYKSGYMPANTIYQLSGPVEKDVRQSYTGGAVDVYIPKFNCKLASSTKNQDRMMKCYDVNALYPFVMANAPMPVGKPVAFTGDIRAIDSKAFGFFYCEITSPSYLEHPILQRKIRTGQGLRTIAGLGTWHGWIFSGEMDNAMRYGYKFTILKGYEFDAGYPFKSYMDKMYNLRMQYVKGDPMNDIAKLLQNSLYGKFGMKSTGTVINMFDVTDPDQVDLFKAMLDGYGLSVQDYIKIDNHIIVQRDDVSRFSYSEAFDMYHGLDVNVAIASAVTAGGRMWMSQFKNNPNFKLYYSDTDSIFVVFLSDNTLIPMIGGDIGKIKLEYTITDAVFLAPKVYAVKTIDGKVIIKVKGVSSSSKSEINFSMIEKLLVQNSEMNFTQERWFKKIIEGEITVSEVAYTLKVTSNKRMPIYQENDGYNIFVGTKPFNYDDIILTPLL